MKWIYLSPHFDDAAFSCGGLIWEQVNSGEEVAVWTICAGEIPPGPLSPYAESLHKRWGTDLNAVSVRKNENALSNQRMGAATRNFMIPDAIYRRSLSSGTHMYDSDAALFSEINLGESSLVDVLGQELLQYLPQVCELVCPLTLGGHVDHRLVRTAAEQSARRMWYYADFPYSVDPEQDLIEQGGEMISTPFHISKAGLGIWEESMAAHASQISTFWSGTDQMRDAIRSYWGKEKGIRLWQFV
ncbi:MAG: PIG-L family deacetylase [Chloroflexota bacterium]|nr:MAG: PIG-L family deacetylase [Chloroflexota bacterium]